MYATPDAFRTALDQRLKSSTPANMAMARHRQLLVFDRFLARAVQTIGDNLILKGGLVLELRLELARTTKDIDLRIDGSATSVLTRLDRCPSNVGAHRARRSPIVASGDRGYQFHWDHR